MSLIVKPTVILLLSSAVGPRLCLPPHSGEGADSASESESGGSTQAETGPAETPTSGAYSTSGESSSSSSTSSQETGYSSESTTSGGGENTSTTMDPPPEVGCGDGMKQQDEECDEPDGNGDDKHCTSECKWNVCGDGKLWEGVESCENPDGLECIGCVANFCGDGVQWMNEACDDGLLGNGPGKPCLADCTANPCGDGILDEDTEECDDKNLDAWDTCSPTCEREFVAFVTKGVFKGDMSPGGFGKGIQAADKICQDAAVSEFPSGGTPFEFRAWIAGSSEELAPVTWSSLLTTSGKPIILRNGLQVATSWGALLDDGPEVAISLTEDAKPALNGTKSDVKWVWTNVDTDGNWVNNFNCSQWMSVDWGGVAIGDLSVKGDAWTKQASSQGICANAKHLYCFSQ